VLVAFEWIISALDETWRTLEQTLRGRSERTFDALTACPGWSVRDVVSHVIGTQLWLNGAEVPELTAEIPPHVRNGQGERNEAFVASRRHVAGDELLDEFRRVTSSAQSRLTEMTDGAWHEMHPKTQRSVIATYETQLVDSWIHLQDVRDALLEPSDDHGAGEELVLHHFEATLGYFWARCGAPEGSLLQMNIAGRSARVVMVRVEEGRGLPVTSTAQTPDVEITTAAALFWRRCAGRISAEAFLRASATDVRGDRVRAIAFTNTLVSVF